MTKRSTKRLAIGFAVLVGVGALSGCDPRDNLQNRDYLPYLDGYERWDTTGAVEAFNKLDVKRSDFACHDELEAAQRSIRREEGGPIKAEGTEPMKRFRSCLEEFSKAAGVDQTKIQAVVLSDWVNHNFLPEIQKRIDGEIASIQKRLDGAGCGGEACKELTIVGDLAMPRLATRDAISYEDAVELCAAENAGGLRPWRLPTKTELATILESDLLPSEAAKVAYWSGERTFDESGEVVALGYRFQETDGDVARPQPESLPFVKRGLPVKAKARCVHDLAKREIAPTDVDLMERTLVQAGCARAGWTKHLRVREGVIVMWESLGKTGPDLESACRELDWCGATWSAPSRDQLKKLSADPWFNESASSRCVASVPEG